MGDVAPRRSGPAGYWKGSASNPYADIPGDALDDEAPVTRRRPEAVPSPTARGGQAAQVRQAQARAGQGSQVPRQMRRATPRNSQAQASGQRSGQSAQVARQPQSAGRPQGSQRPQASQQPQVRSSSQGTRVVRSAQVSADGTRVVRNVPSAGQTRSARPQARIETPLPPRPTIRGASMAGTDRLARAEAARRALDSEAYFLDESLQPRKGRSPYEAQAGGRAIPSSKLHFWRWFRTLPIVVMALFGAASIIVSLGLFGIDKLLYPVQYNDTIAQMADAYGVDPLLVSAVIRTESSWNPEAVSRMGAVGLMQLLPGTAADLAASGAVDATRYDPTNLLDPETNIAYGTAYLRDCIANTEDLDQAIAAYNAGIAAAQGWAQSGTSFEEAIQYPETTAYLERVKENLERYQQTYPEGIPPEEAQ